VTGLDRAVAIVGMAGRFPGADDVDELWCNLVAGLESVEPIDPDTLVANGVHEALAADPRYVARRGRLDGAELFDAPLFGYSPREAALTDPQQRVLLECAWQALHHSGRHGAGERIGVYTATGANGYLQRQVLASPGDLDVLGLLTVLLGNEKDHAATRIAHRLDLRGPAVAVQTACSSSLSAVHLAVHSLLAGECDAALAGGASVAVPQDVGYLYDEHGIMSPDGRCRAFDRYAAGTATGSGAAVIVLRRAADAIADGDNVYALIVGSAMNNDGARKVGYTAPSIQGQADVIRRALHAAGLRADDIGYLEAHGTGTPLGDAMEIASLTEAFRADTDRTAFCRIGSIKPNIGHLDAAAGIAGLIKAALALHHGVIPPSINCAEPNADLAGTPFIVNTTVHPWLRTDTPRRCSVSSFGMGGTNVHMVLEEAPTMPPDPVRAGPRLVPLSANTDGALQRVRQRLDAYLTRDPHANLSDISRTLREGRAPLAHRVAVVASDAAGLRRQLASTSAQAGPPPRTIAFLFPGQGAQRAGMAAGLYDDLDVFRSIVDECADRLAPELGLDIREPLCGDNPELVAALGRTEVTQPALFTVEYALAGQLKAWGITPNVLIGHSVGQYAAACLAGVFDLTTALRLIAARGRAMAAAPPGGMLAVAAAADAVASFLHGDLALAAENGPASVVVGGPRDQLAGLAVRLESAGIDSVALRVNHAFHTGAMDSVLPTLREALRGCAAAPTRLRMVENVRGQVLPVGSRIDPEYWTAHLREPVRFGAGLARVLALPRPVLIEVGPGTALTAFAHLQPGMGGYTALATMPAPGTGEASQALLEAVGTLWTLQAPVDLGAVQVGTRGRRIPLPNYPFDHERHWIEAAPAPTGAATGSAAARPGPSARPYQDAPALPQPPASEPVRGDADLVRAQLAAIWCDLIGIEAVADGTNFYSVGGHSLLAVRLLARIRTTFGVELSLQSLLRTPTFGALSTLLHTHGRVHNGHTADHVG
jgi:acyl transferase domain-containing protein